MRYYNVDKGVHDQLRREKKLADWDDCFEEDTDYRVAYGVKVMLKVLDRNLAETGKYLAPGLTRGIIKKHGDLAELKSVWSEWDAERKCVVYKILAEGKKIEVCVKKIKGGESWVHSYTTVGTY